MDSSRSCCLSWGSEGILFLESAAAAAGPTWKGCCDCGGCSGGGGESPVVVCLDCIRGTWGETMGMAGGI